MCDKKKLKSYNYKNPLETPQLENQINHLGKNKIEINSLKKHRKELKN